MQNKCTFLLQKCHSCAKINTVEIDGELAVLCNLQSAIVGLNTCLRFDIVKYVYKDLALKSRSYAIKISEPCQSLTAASLRGHFDVP